MHKQLPKYIVIKNDIKNRIKTGYYEIGDYIPSEKSLAENYSVSLITIKKALEILVNEGLLKKQKGKGTFVCEPPSTHKNTSIDYVEFIVAMGSEFDGNLTRILKGCEEYLSTKGKSLIIKYSNNDIDVEAREIENVIERGINGLLIFSNDPDKNIRYLLELRKIGTPFVLIDRFTKKMSVSFVTSDNMDGVYRATEKLVSIGHTKIALLSLNKYKGISSVIDRGSGYLSAMKNLCSPDIKPCIYIQEENGIELLTNEIQKGGISAVISVCGDLTTDFINACCQKNIEIPKDVSIISFDEPKVKFQNCDISIIEQNFTKMGYEGARILCHSIDNMEYGCSKNYIPTRLILRDSVRPYSK